MRSPHVVVGWHDWGLVNGNFAFSLARAIAYEGGRINSCIRMPSPYTEEARNRVVETFLEMPSTEYLLMVDGDIEFEKDAISKTMWVAQNFGAQVVWGNYALGTFSNSLFKKDPDSELAISLDGLAPNMVYEAIYAGGTGWCLMTRKLLEEMKTTYPGPWHWFNRDEVPGEGGKLIKMGEDLSFGRRVAKMGRKQIGYTGIFLIHHKFHPTAPHFMQQVVEELGSTMVMMNQPPESKDGLTPVVGVQEHIPDEPLKVEDVVSS